MRSHGKITRSQPRTRRKLRNSSSSTPAKAYFAPPKSLRPAPFFFIRKKDGKLRPVQTTYVWTNGPVRNKRTRSPLILPQLITMRRSRVLVSKFAIRWDITRFAFEWKTSGKQPSFTNVALFRTYGPMFFWLTNSPPPFND